MPENPYWNSKPDLTRLPEHLRQALAQAIPIRPGEIHAQTIIFPLIQEQGLNHPNGRIRALPYTPKADVMTSEGVQLEASNFIGHKPIYVTVMRTAECPEFLKGFIACYVRTTGSWTAFDKLVEELKCNSPL
jgi:hypothetical protein